jgi:hypothetical protein
MEYKDNFEQLNETCLSDVQHWNYYKMING